MPVLSDCGWGWVPVEGQRHAECQMRKWGGGAENGGCKKVFFHLVLRQGSDLGLDE